MGRRIWRLVPHYHRTNSIKWKTEKSRAIYDQLKRLINKISTIVLSIARFG